MLQKLDIKNYILIESISIDFESGFTSLTGETGAGKSILLGALSLLLGERADFSNFFNPDKKFTVEGTFELSSYDLKSFFEQNDLDYEELSIIRREVIPNGKSRAFINDTPVKLFTLKEIGKSLIDVHSQFSTQQINDSKYRLNIIDAIADTKEDILLYQTVFKKFKATKRKLKEVEKNFQELARDQEFISFQFKELEALELNEGEEKELESEYDVMSNSEDLQSLYSNITKSFEGEEFSLNSNLKSVLNLLQEAAALNENLKELMERFHSSLIEMEDILHEVELISDGFEYNEERFVWLEERLAEIHRLKLKHGLLEADQLIEKRKEYSEKLNSVNHFEEYKSRLNKELLDLEEDIVKKANQISEKRIEVLNDISERVKSVLVEIGIPDASFSIKREETELNDNGKDNFQFLFTANKGKQMQDVSKSASGGELSRIMLALKILVANKLKLPTIIFDEIDTGVSGEIADHMGKILKELGRNRQVISITHLPQVAAKGDRQIRIYKTANKEGKTISELKILSKEDRLQEIAKMLSGEKLTDASINNAKELLSH